MDEDGWERMGREDGGSEEDGGNEADDLSDTQR